MKLCLGTCNFGMKYGLKNKNRQVPKDEVFRILDYAYSEGIRYIDTAQAYGNAEEIIGEWIKSRKIKDLKVITKLLPNCLDKIDLLNVEKEIKTRLKQSLKRLNVDKLDGVLLHTPEYFYYDDIMDALIECKNYTKHIGVSVYEMQHAVDIVNSGIIDYVQIPYSIFDQRMNIKHMFTKAQEKGIKIFARSAFLQGLILMDNSEVPEHLVKATPFLKEFDEIVKRYNMSRQQAALLFSAWNPNVDYTVFGVDNLEQVKEDIRIFDDCLRCDPVCNYHNRIKTCLMELENRFEIEDSMIIPSLWAKKKG